MSSVNELIDAAKKFLMDTWGEETISMEITENEVIKGNGKLHTNCTVRLGGSTSRWHKIFTFKNGKVMDEEYHLL